MLNTGNGWDMIYTVACLVLKVTHLEEIHCNLLVTATTVTINSTSLKGKKYLLLFHNTQPLKLIKTLVFIKRGSVTTGTLRREVSCEPKRLPGKLIFTHSLKYFFPLNGLLTIISQLFLPVNLHTTMASIS